MKFLALTLLLSCVLFSSGKGVELIVSSEAPATPPPNPQIDMNGYLRVATEAAKVRESRRLSEAEFLRMSAEKGTFVLDARSKEKYDMVHVKGAINLNFSDIAIETLHQMIPDKTTRILIYCNNNFQVVDKKHQPINAKVPMAKIAFMTKMPTASLNLSTFIALHNYGYTNVYELAPLLDPETTKLTLVASPPVKR